MEESQLLSIVVDKYFKEFKSIATIAKEHSTYPNDIRRMLLKGGFSLRDKSQAQKMSLATGQHEHPTKGKERSDEVKLKISKGLAANWDNISDDEKARRANISKENWHNMSVSEREAFRTAASKAILKAAKEGSKIEKIILTYLTDKGFRPLFHHEMMLPNERMQIDIFLPEMATAIEIDGPTHFMPIWGEDKLQKQISADNEKNGLLLSAGFSIVRVKYNVSKVTLKYQSELEEALTTVLEELSARQKKDGKLAPELILLDVSPKREV
jgi:very-short-patch-repair endonuclease